MRSLSSVLNIIALTALLLTSYLCCC